MGLGNTEDGGGGLPFSVLCSICLEVVADNGDRSWAKLQCGHQFHLDCIGSAFNVKGAMQCPNCRKIEKGQWLYRNGCRSFPELSMEDWIHDEDLYDLSYSEMSFGVHWCPFGQLARLPSPLLEGEFSSGAYHDISGQHAISATHPCPYAAYFEPVHPSNSSGSASDSSNFRTHWNTSPVPGEVPTPYAFPGMDLRHHTWEHHHHSPPISIARSRIAGGDHPSVLPVAPRSARPNSDISRSGSFMHPLRVGHSSGARPGGLVASHMTPPYPGSNARAHDRVQALQAYYEHQQPGNATAMRPPVVTGTRRSGSHRRMAEVASSSDQNSVFHFFPPGASDTENPPPNRFDAWERENYPSFPPNQVDRDIGWGAFHQAGIRSSNLRQRHGSERTLSHNWS